MTDAEFERLPRVRIINNAGPCLTGYRRLRNNRTTVSVIYRNGDGYSVKRVRAWAVHDGACSLCPGGASYPNGYMD